MQCKEKSNQWKLGLITGHKGNFKNEAIVSDIAMGAEFIIFRENKIVVRKQASYPQRAPSLYEQNNRLFVP